MICPVEIAHDMSALRAVRMRDHAEHGDLSEGRDGAGNESTGVQDVMLQAMAKKITWWQAAEILGISDRHIRRWRERYVEEGYDGLLDRRRGKTPARAGG